MTLVIPNYYTRKSSPAFSSSLAAARNATAMPCGFDGEPMDFEAVSASFDPGSCWPTLDDLAEYRGFSGSGQPGVAGSSSNKRKEQEIESDEGGENDTKKFRIEVGGTDDTSDNQSDCDSSSSSSEGSSGVPDGGDDDFFCPPRRRGPLLWSPKLRWKDERRKVLKISLAKIRLIEDPEVFLCRSVLINNTLKRLQREIQEEKNSRFHDPYFSYSSSGDDSQDGNDTATRGWGFESQLEDGFPRKGPRLSEPTSPPSTTSSTATAATQEVSTTTSVSLNASCDEIFGVNEDMLRINIPQKACSRERGQIGQQCSLASPSHPRSNSHQSPSPPSSSTPSSSPSTSTGESTCTCRANNSTTTRGSCAEKRPILDPVSRHFDLSSTSGHCAMQYRAVQEHHHIHHHHGEILHGGSVLDSVVYHSLLASLES